MANITITEALAEVKTIDKRLDKKREFVLGYLFRQNLMRDPLDKDGGSKKVIEQERQSITDLENRKVQIRKAIRLANEATPITVLNQTKSIAEWLTWRKEVAPSRQKFVVQIRQKLDAVRREAQQKGVSVQAEAAAANTNDVIINLSEADLGKQAEELENILGSLDGQLSLKNATVMVEV